MFTFYNLSNLIWSDLKVNRSKKTDKNNNLFNCLYVIKSMQNDVFNHNVTFSIIVLLVRLKLSRKHLWLLHFLLWNSNWVCLSRNAKRHLIFDIWFETMNILTLRGLIFVAYAELFISLRIRKKNVNFNKFMQFLA